MKLGSVIQKIPMVIGHVLVVVAAAVVVVFWVVRRHGGLSRGPPAVLPLGMHRKKGGKERQPCLEIPSSEMLYTTLVGTCSSSAPGFRNQTHF